MSGGAGHQARNNVGLSLSKPVKKGRGIKKGGLDDPLLKVSTDSTITYVGLG